MIDITKPHQTRDGRAVSNLHRNHIGLLEGDVAGHGTNLWLPDGRMGRQELSALDLIPETRMKETALTANQARKAKEHNKMVDESTRLYWARVHVLDAMRICAENDLRFDTLVLQVRNEGLLIRMGRKYRTLNGEKADIRLTDGQGDYPVAGFIDGDKEIRTWTAFGKHVKGCDSYADLVLDEDAQ